MEAAGWEPRGAESSARRPRGGGAAAAARGGEGSGSGWRPRSSHALPPGGPRAAAAPVPESGGGGPGKPGGSSRADRRAALPVSGRAGLPQPWCFHHAREGKEGRADGGRGGKEAEGQAVGEASGRASPRTSTTSLFTPPRPALPRPAGPTGRGGVQSPARESEAGNQALTPAALENPVRMEHRDGPEAEAAPWRPEREI